MLILEYGGDAFNAVEALRCNTTHRPGPGVPLWLSPYFPSRSREWKTVPFQTAPCLTETETERESDIYYQVGRRPEKIVKWGVKLREAEATTLRRVLLARSCAVGGEDVVGEVKGVDELGVKVASRVARSRGDRRSEIEVDSKRRGLRHDMSDLALETVEESRAFGKDIVLIGLRWLTC